MTTSIGNSRTISRRKIFQMVVARRCFLQLVRLEAVSRNSTIAFFLGTFLVIAVISAALAQSRSTETAANPSCLLSGLYRSSGCNMPESQASEGQNIKRIQVALGVLSWPKGKCRRG
jgi:hypothetical protein